MTVDGRNMLRPYGLVNTYPCEPLDTGKEESMAMQPPQMEHSVLRKQEGTYAAFPVIELLADGRLAVAYLSNGANIRDHYGFGDWTVVTSADGGATFTPAAPDDMSVPFNWSGTSPRERYDRFAGRMPDGTLVAAGGVGFEEAPEDRAEEASAAGRSVSEHPLRDDSTVLLGGNRVFVQRSHDGGRTWERQEWEVPGAHRLNGFPRCTVLADGTILAPLYDGGDIAPDRSRVLVYRSTDHGATWNLRLVGSGASGGYGDESALVETEPGARARPDPQCTAAVGRGVVGRWWANVVGGDPYGHLGLSAALVEAARRTDSVLLRPPARSARGTGGHQRRWRSELGPGPPVNPAR